MMNKNSVDRFVILCMIYRINKYIDWEFLQWSVDSNFFKDSIGVIIDKIGGYC